MGWLGVLHILFGVVFYFISWQKYANRERDEMWLGLIVGTGFLLLGIGSFVGFNAPGIITIALLILFGAYFSLKVHLKKSSPNWWKWYK